MLSIVIQNGSWQEAAYGWHVNSGELRLMDSEIKDVVEVQADGHELEHIIHYSTLPHVEIQAQPVQKWFGDDAKFIVANLLFDDRRG